MIELIDSWKKQLDEDVNKYYKSNRITRKVIGKINELKYI